jgi:hypothetical protein
MQYENAEYGIQNKSCFNFCKNTKVIIFRLSQGLTVDQDCFLILIGSYKAKSRELLQNIIELKTFTILSRKNILVDFDKKFQAFNF